MDKIKNNLDKPWDWEELSSNIIITWNIIKNNLDKPWDQNNISKNLNINIENINNNLDKPWNWEILTQNEMTMVSMPRQLQYYRNYY